MNIESIVKTSRTPGEDAPLPHIQRILVGVDFSDTSKAALDYAMSMADKFGATVNLVHAVEPCSYPDDLELAARISMDEIDARWTKAKKRELEACRKAAAREGTSATVNGTRGAAWMRIVETANSWHADLIVIGTRGLTGLKHVLMGSTAERVVRHAACPVLVVHAGQNDSSGRFGGRGCQRRTVV